MTANERQVGGDHYKTGGMEHWDVVAHFGLDYFQGVITKDVFRWRKKGGVEDLQKAKHYLEKYIEVNSGGDNEAQPGDQDADILITDLRGRLQDTERNFAAMLQTMQDSLTAKDQTINNLSGQVESLNLKIEKQAEDISMLHGFVECITHGDRFGALEEYRRRFPDAEHAHFPNALYRFITRCE